jgi:hypothetical protein
MKNGGAGQAPQNFSVTFLPTKKVTESVFIL